MVGSLGLIEDSGWFTDKFPGFDKFSENRLRRPSVEIPNLKVRSGFTTTLLPTMSDGSRLYKVVYQIDSVVFISAVILESALILYPLSLVRHNASPIQIARKTFAPKTYMGSRDITESFHPYSRL